MTEHNTELTINTQSGEVINYKLLSAAEIAQRATTVYHQTQHTVYRAQAIIMESLWAIRHHHCDDSDDEFLDYAQRLIRFASPKKALELAKTWAGVRKNRELRELAYDEPKEAIKMIGLLTDGGMLEVVDDDAEVARLLTMTPRKRSKAIRELIEVKKSIDEGHHPADKETIKTLEAERDAALDELKQRDKVVELNNTPQACFNQLIKAMRFIDTELAAINQQADSIFGKLNDDSVSDDDVLGCQDALNNALDSLDMLTQAIGRRWATKLTRLDQAE